MNFTNAGGYVFATFLLRAFSPFFPYIVVGIVFGFSLVYFLRRIQGSKVDQPIDSNDGRFKVFSQLSWVTVIIVSIIVFIFLVLVTLKFVGLIHGF